MLESLYNKVAGLAGIIKKSLQHKCVPVNKTRFLRSPGLNNICERLLLSNFNTVTFTLSSSESNPSITHEISNAFFRHATTM